MLRYNCWFVCVLLYLSNLTQANTIEYDGWVNIQLLHALDASENPTFTYRGNITIQSLQSGTSVAHQSPPTQAERIKLRDLAANNKFYKLKTIVTSSHYKGEEVTFISTVKACMLAESELHDIISISVDYSGRVITVTLAVASTSTCEGAVVPIDKLHQFNTYIYLRSPKTGPAPDTISYIQKLERERLAKERGEVKDNRSFLAKYWMYIVPVVIIMVLSSAANPEGAGGGGGGASR